MFINTPREDFVIFLLNRYLEIIFGVIKRVEISRCANGHDIPLVNLVPIAIFSNFKLTRSSGKHLEDISHAHIGSLLYKLINSAKDSDDLSIGFDRDKNRRQNELCNNENVEGKFFIRNMLKVVFGFAEHHEKAKKLTVALVIN